jgi:acyl-CoA synthetase (AMP-forming)/AMP-acid ligase II
MEVAHWDIRTLGLPASVRVQILHDPADAMVPVDDSYRIAASISAEVQPTTPGVGHHRVVSCGEMRSALSARILGRTDDTMDVARHRISSGQIEAVVSKHAGVAECAVAGARDPLKDRFRTR